MQLICTNSGIVQYASVNTRDLQCCKQPADGAVARASPTNLVQDYANALPREGGGLHHIGEAITFSRRKSR